MTHSVNKSFPTTAGERTGSGGSWVNKIPESQTQLLFSRAMPTSVHNRATRVCSPAPIIIEKLVSRTEKNDQNKSCKSSLCLSVISEERLQAAVKLAKRDLHRKRHESLKSPSHHSRERSPSHEIHDAASSQNGPSTVEKQCTGSSKRGTCSQVLVYTSPKCLGVSMADVGQSSPTKDPGLSTSSGKPQLSREIQKLQKELSAYVQRIEQLISKGRTVEPLEPDEKHKIEIRHQKQAARSSRMIYVLQQQVNEIQQDLDKLRFPSTGPAKRCRAVDRLAAAHRGTVRAMQAFINQLSDPTECRVPAQFKELGKVIRQLLQCSAKVESGQSSALPSTTRDILQKLEILDSALSKLESPLEKICINTVSPIRDQSPKNRAVNLSPPRVPTSRAAQKSKKLSVPKKNVAGRKGARQPRRAGKLSNQERSDILKAGIMSLVRQKEENQGEAAEAAATETIPKPAVDVVNAEKNKLVVPARDAGFQQPTVSSRLREVQPAQKETTLPWIPTSPHSSTKQRAVASKPEPRCLFSPEKSPSLPTGVQSHSGDQEKISAENVKKSENKAPRVAWLDALSENILRELNPSGKAEKENMSKTRTAMSSPTRCVEFEKNATRQRLQPLAHNDEAAAFADLSAGALLEITSGSANAFEGAEYRLIHNPVLENTLLRMEQIEKDEESVRRRYAMIAYSDPFLELNHADLRKEDSCRPGSPQPIRLTRPIQKPPRTEDIHLQTPVETGVESESSIAGEHPALPTPSCAITGRQKGRIHVSVPSSMLENIQRYRENHDSYLRLVSHEEVGRFNPWVIAESLAEELLNEALADVAAEVQDFNDNFVEAVFTSEFLQPLQSPSSVLKQCD